MEKKITKKDQYNKAIELLGNYPDLVEFFKHEIELLDRKAMAKTNSKANKEKAEKEQLLYDVLAQFNEPITATELLVKAGDSLSALADEGENLSVQRVSAYLKKLVDGGRAEKVIIKKKSYFSISDKK